jgi:cyclic pyranopterin phosphate synthase
VISALAMAITIIGIPLALANLKLIPVSLVPLGKEIVPDDVPKAPAADDRRLSWCAVGTCRPIERAPADGPLVDTYGRVATDLRVSLTDRCNLRCTYCMPAEGLDWLPGEQLLTRRADPAAAHRGHPPRRHQRPLHRRRAAGGTHLEEVVARDGRAAPRPEIALTTNGIGLAARRAAEGRRAGPRQRVAGHRRRRALSADITARDRLSDVLAGLGRAHGRGLTPVKVNAVLDPTRASTTRCPLLRFCLRTRTISCASSSRCRWTPATQWSATQTVGADDVLRPLRRHFD